MDEAPSPLQRKLVSSLQVALTDTPVVCILGSRQSGKSTLAKLSSNEDRDYLSFDDHNLYTLAKNDPQGFVSRLPEKVTIDEVQRVPEILLSIKYAVDNHRVPGRFLLTGSSNLLQLPTLADSLAGRMECLTLHPLTESEKLQTPGNFLKNLIENDLDEPLAGSEINESNDLAQRLCMGGYPEPRLRTPSRAAQWHRQYLNSIMQRDIKDIANIHDYQQVKRVMQLAANRTAELLNVSSFGSSLKLDRKTVNSYLAILENLYLIRQLPAWHKNSAKRLIKAPKLHVCDSGLAATLTKTQPDKWDTKRDHFGHLLESFIVQQIIAQAGWTDPDLNFYHYRDKDRVEVDCVIELDNQIWGIEVKTSATLSDKDGKGLRRLADQAGKDFQMGILLYNGTHVISLPQKNCLAVPLSRVWEL